MLLLFWNNPNPSSVCPARHLAHLWEARFCNSNLSFLESHDSTDTPAIFILFVAGTVLRGAGSWGSLNHLMSPHTLWTLTPHGKGRCRLLPHSAISNFPILKAHNNRSLIQEAFLGPPNRSWSLLSKASQSTHLNHLTGHSTSCNVWQLFMWLLFNPAQREGPWEVNCRVPRISIRLDMALDFSKYHLATTSSKRRGKRCITLYARHYCSCSTYITSSLFDTLYILVVLLFYIY